LTQQQNWVDPDKTLYPLPRVKRQDLNRRLRQAKQKLEEEFEKHPSVKLALQEVYSALSEVQKERIL
jgi:hypothetical protein